GAEISSAPLPLEAKALIVEDLDRLSPDRRAEVEERVFHLHNALAARSAPLLFTGRTPPAQWRVELPDLASRLSAASVARIEPPDDALLEALLRKHFKDRQLAVADDAIEFLLMRMERSFAAADALAGMIDTAALKEGRDITRRFVADLLREAEGSSL
ncbi:MAG: DnaA/Hda family protein, partial [Pseudomonadota bacterium]